MTQQEQPTSSRRRGRRPGPGSTRQTVLDSARARFAAHGFTETTIRLVATDAGVDASQVMQFYKSKEDLFAAAMALPASALRRIDTAFDGPDDHLGERVIRAFLTAWEGAAEESEPLLAMLRGAIVNETASRQLAGFIESRLLTGTANRTNEDAALRAAVAASMLVGLITGRTIIGVPTLAEANIDAIVTVAAPGIQRILAG